MQGLNGWPSTHRHHNGNNYGNKDLAICTHKKFEVLRSEPVHKLRSAKHTGRGGEEGGGKGRRGNQKGRRTAPMSQVGMPSLVCRDMGLEGLRRTADDEGRNRTQ